jgi:hypothetical protein
MAKKAQSRKADKSLVYTSSNSPEKPCHTAKILPFPVRLAGRGALVCDAVVVRGESALKPDKAQAARHLAMLDPEATTFTFQVFDDNKERKKAHDHRNKERKRAGKKALPDPYARTIHGTLEQRWHELVRWNEQGAGVYITVNHRQSSGWPDVTAA